MEFINKMNEMFNANPYMDSDRVTVEYAEKTNVVIVKVLNKIELVKADEYTAYGLMYAVLDKVKEMYG